VLSQTAIFTKLVRAYMGPPPVLVSGSEGCGEVVRKVREARATSALVVNHRNNPRGIVTEQDICRKIAFQRDQDDPVSEVMTNPVKTVKDDSYLYHAIADMRRSELRHLPVVDYLGRTVGVLHLHEVLEAAAVQVVEQIDLLTHSETIDGMKKTKAAQAEVAVQLLKDSVPAPEIQSLVTSINNDLYRRIVGLIVWQMMTEGWGPPPVRFDVIVMGSGGRGESYLYPDQDNGFILEDYPDERHDEVDRWFIELANRMTDALNETGFTYCNGYVMANNPLWRKSVSQWRQQIGSWIGKGSGMVLRLSDIFFDFDHVYGDGDLTRQLRKHVTKISREPFFLREMFKFDQEHEVALGPFNRLLKDKLDGPQKGKINLKLTGTLPLVGAVRISALANGIDETSTLRRIDALHKQGWLSSDEQDYLAGAYQHIAKLLLRQQLRDYGKGKKVGNHVAKADLSKRERDILVDALKVIKKYRKRLKSELTGDIF
jgi:signal-transduction protein with cAMP-binding, CBS, and nucleotidyltransferase domain